MEGNATGTKRRVDFQPGEIFPLFRNFFFRVMEKNIFFPLTSRGYNYEREEERKERT